MHMSTPMDLSMATSVNVPYSRNNVSDSNL